MTSRFKSTEPYDGQPRTRRLPRVARLAIPVLTIGTLTTALPTAALEYRLGVGYTLETTDNVGRTPDNEVSDFIHIPQARFSANHVTPQFDIDANYRFQHRIYVEDLFQDRTRLTGSAALSWKALPERLRINVSNSRTEATIQTLQQDIENNRQLTTVTSVGPVLSLRPRPSDRLNLEYRFSDVTEEETASDSERQLVRFGYVVGAVGKSSDRPRRVSRQRDV